MSPQQSREDEPVHTVNGQATQVKTGIAEKQVGGAASPRELNLLRGDIHRSTSDTSSALSFDTSNTARSNSSSTASKLRQSICGDCKRSLLRNSMIGCSKCPRYYHPTCAKKHNRITDTWMCRRCSFKEGKTSHPLFPSRSRFFGSSTSTTDEPPKNSEIGIGSAFFEPRKSVRSAQMAESTDHTTTPSVSQPLQLAPAEQVRAETELEAATNLISGLRLETAAPTVSRQTPSTPSTKAPEFSQTLPPDLMDDNELDAEIEQSPGTSSKPATSENRDLPTILDTVRKAPLSVLPSKRVFVSKKSQKDGSHCFSKKKHRVYRPVSEPRRQKALFATPEPLSQGKRISQQAKMAELASSSNKKQDRLATKTGSASHQDKLAPPTIAKKTSQPIASLDALDFFDPRPNQSSPKRPRISPLTSPLANHSHSLTATEDITAGTIKQPDIMVEREATSEEEIDLPASRAQARVRSSFPGFTATEDLAGGSIQQPDSLLEYGFTFEVDIQVPANPTQARARGPAPEKLSSSSILSQPISEPDDPELEAILSQPMPEPPKDLDMEVIAAKRREIDARPSRKNRAARSRNPFDYIRPTNPLVNSRVIYAVSGSDDEDGSGGERLKPISKSEFREMTGVPKNPMPILTAGKQLALRDGTKNSRGELPRAKEIFPVASSNPQSMEY